MSKFDQVQYVLQEHKVKPEHSLAWNLHYADQKYNLI